MIRCTLGIRQCVKQTRVYYCILYTEKNHDGPPSAGPIMKTVSSQVVDIQGFLNITDFENGAVVGCQTTS